ncbi:MAG: hypothetical protein WC838_06750 [Candidatus Margulisiibacteriota bacterium]
MTSTTSKRTTLFLHSAIAKHARAQAILEEISLASLVEKALLLYLPPKTVIKKPTLP